MRIYLDSCVVIYLVEEYTPEAKKIGRQLSDLPVVACGSGAVRMECLVGPLKNKDHILLEAYRVFLDSLELLPVKESSWDLAAELRANFGLLLPDALHLAIAETNACEEFWTSDRHFRRMAAHTRTRIRLLD